MSKLEEFENESIPVTYCLEEAKSLPEYRDARPLEQMLSRYYYRNGNVKLGDLVVEIIRYNYTPPEQFNRSSLNNEDAKEILTLLIKKGIIDAGYHFVAVYRILTDFCDFPKDYTEFSRCIIDLDLELDGEPIEFDSLRQSISKSIKSHPVLIKPYKKWTEHKSDNDEKYNLFRRQKAVADALIKNLRDRKILLKG